MLCNPQMEKRREIRLLRCVVFNAAKSSVDTVSILSSIFKFYFIILSLYYFILILNLIFMNIN
jgi:hypothetical protein